jgi:hypothetical protein
MSKTHRSLAPLASSQYLLDNEFSKHNYLRRDRLQTSIPSQRKQHPKVSHQVQAGPKPNTARPEPNLGILPQSRASQKHKATPGESQQLITRSVQAWLNGPLARRLRMAK